MKKPLCMLLAVLTLLSLCACGQSAAPAANEAVPAEADAPEAGEEIPEEAPDVTYEVTVTDADGNPIPGVTLQLCDDVMCTMGETDGNGVAVFTGKDAPCTVHVLKVPMGVIGTDEEYGFQSADRTETIVLETAEPTMLKPEAGFCFYAPEKYRELHAPIGWDSRRADDLIYVIRANYVSSDHAVPRYGKDYKTGELFEVICVLKDASEAEEYLKDKLVPKDGWENVSLEEIGTAEKLTCFLSQDIYSEEDLQLYQENMGELFEEFMALRENKEAFLSGIQLRKPVPETLLFETTDLEGNPVDLAEIFASHKVTMINVWDVGCVPCVQLLPYLQGLNQNFEEKDCQIIGICTDYHPGEDTSKAQNILTKAGVTYLNVVLPEGGIPVIAELSSSPSFLYVDSDGVILKKPFSGAFIGEYRQIYTDELDESLSMLEG